MKVRMSGGSESPSPEADWQRLSPWSIVFILVGGILRFVRENLPLVFGAGVGAAVFEGIGLVEVTAACGLLLALAAVLSVAFYRRFRFRLDGDVLLVRRGLIERKELKLQAGRIQHIAIRQPFYMRPFRLVRFSVDTPGSTAAEVELPGIRTETAEFLRARLHAVRHGSPGDGESTVDSAGDRDVPVLFRVTPWNLTLHGVASNYAYVMAAALSPFLHRIERAVAERIGEVDFWERFADAAGSPLIAAAGLVIGVVLIMVTISVVVSWLRFYGFVLTRDDGRFTQRSGLFNRQEQVLSLSTLQAVESIQTAVGRIIRRRHLVCRQFGVAELAGESGGRTFLVPGLDEAAERRLGGEFWPGANPDPVLRRVSPFYRRVLTLRFGLAFAPMFLFLAAALWQPVWLLGVPGLLLILWLLVYQHWRTVGWAIDREYAYFRSGLFGRKLTVFPPRNAQRAELIQSWFQRRRGVATVRLSLPSGMVTFPFLAEADARFLVNESIYRIETAGFQFPKPAPRVTNRDACGD